MQHWTHLQNRGQGTGLTNIPRLQPTSRGPEKSMELDCKDPEGQEASNTGSERANQQLGD